MHKLLNQAGFQADNYGTHSFRIGRCGDLLLRYHLDVEIIKKLGRWKTNVVFDYLKQF